MEKMDMINTFVKIFLITFFTYFTYEKIIRFKHSNINYIIVSLISVTVSVMYIILNNFLPPLINILILYTIYGIIIDKIIKTQINYIVYIFSCVIAYAIYLISIVIAGIIILLLFNQIEKSNLICLIIIPIVCALMFLFIFSRKRFKNGFNFLKNKEINNNIKNYIVFFIGLIIIVFGLLQEIDNNIFELCILIGTIFIMVSLTIWIKTQITITYKNKMRNRTIEIQKTEIDEKSKIIDEIKAENLKLASAVHKYNKKISALEFAMKNALEIETKSEFANELSVILEETKEASKNFAKETEVKTSKLVLTNIPGIDNMFKYMQEEARKKDINFDLKLNTNINPLIENSISKDKLETLIGDHLKDAIIAVNASNKSYKSMLVTLGPVDGIYELSIHDTGIEFEIETLLKLGQEQITTHKEEGGSGIGFMTTFETLKECKASLIIEEYNTETTNYTKTVTIRFDGRNEYKIISYRAEEIKKQNKGRKIIVEKLK